MATSHELIDWDLARYLFRFANFVYDDDDALVNVRIKSTHTTHFINIPISVGHVARAVIAHNKQEIILSFRGCTGQGFEDVLAVFYTGWHKKHGTFKPSLLFSNESTIELNPVIWLYFRTLVDAVDKYVTRIPEYGNLRDKRKIYVTGFSMGAALAQLMFKYKSNDLGIHTCVTFAGPAFVRGSPAELGGQYAGPSTFFNYTAWRSKTCVNIMYEHDPLRIFMELANNYVQSPSTIYLLDKQTGSNLATSMKPGYSYAINASNHFRSLYCSLLRKLKVIKTNRNFAYINDIHPSKATDITDSGINTIIPIMKQRFPCFSTCN